MVDFECEDEKRLVAGAPNHFRNSIRAKAPEVASVYLRQIYRALFTRPLRSLRVYSVDAETRQFLRARILALAPPRCCADTAGKPGGVSGGASVESGPFVAPTPGNQAEIAATIRGMSVKSPGAHDTTTVEAT